MGVFSSIAGVMGRSSGTVFMFIVLAVSDHLWGENVFNCPCGPYRILYTMAFLVVPPVVIIFIDTSWRVLFKTCQMCCDEWDADDSGSRNHLPSEQKRRCCSGRNCCLCCSRTTCETLIRLFIRPILIAILWLIFSCMEPKFGRCLYKEVPCNCTQKEVNEHQCTDELKVKTANMRVFMACLCLGFTGVACVTGLLYVVCKTCIRCYRRRAGCFRICRLCRSWKYHRIEDEESSEKIRELCKCLYTFGVKPKTVIRLQQDDLMCERRLMLMSETSLLDIGRSVGLAQLEILREHRTNLRLARWMMDQKYTPDSIKTILERENLLESAILDAIRESLHRTDGVEDAKRELLEADLRKKGMGHLLPSPAGEDYHRAAVGDIYL